MLVLKQKIWNDIIGIVDENNEVIVKYYYDAFGKTIKIIDSSLINLSQINPFRYRSYYLDNETGLYYLNSRYYDTLTCRFISMDLPEIATLDQGNLLQHNLFSYCLNDPVNRWDPNGNLWWLIPMVAELIEVAIVVVAAVAICVVADEVAKETSTQPMPDIGGFCEDVGKAINQNMKTIVGILGDPNP